MEGLETMKSNNEQTAKRKSRKSGIPTGNAGEYFVMGELLRRGYDVQLADRNTKDYDILVVRPNDKVLKLQVKSVRSQPWYVKKASFSDAMRDQVTIYVLLGDESARKPIRYFITRNQEVAEQFHCPPKWRNNAFMPLKAVEQYEDNWDILLS
jgi:hypothetical protein